jgi:hypothetical protein
VSSKNVTEVKDKFFSYKTDPLAFVTDILRVQDISAYHHISDQQKELLEWTGFKVAANYRNWNISQLGRKDLRITDEGKEAARQMGASVMSGKGNGKDAVVSWLCIWAICCFENCKVFVIAPNERSVKQILWPEIAKWCDAMLPTQEYAFKLRDFVKVEREMVYFTDVPKPKFDRTIEPIIVSPQLNDEQKVSVVSGRHEKNMFFIFEEACGIDDKVFEPIEDTLTSENNFCFQIFNPNRTGGYAVNSQKPEMARFWKQMHWNSEESSIASKENIARLRDLYGVDSNKYRTNVLGLPPLADEESLIPHDWVMEAAMADIEPDPDASKIMGVDPARFGGDESIILIRQGRVVIDIRRYKEGLDGRKLAELMMEADFDHDGVDKVYIDAVGVGASPYDFSKDHFRQRIVPVIVARRPDDPERFFRLRDELWWKCREWFSDGMVKIPYDNDFIEQLSSIKYQDHPKVKVEGKKELKKRKGSDGSPDIGDALCLTFRHNSKNYRNRLTPAYSRRKTAQRGSWMSA